MRKYICTLTLCLFTVVGALMVVPATTSALPATSSTLPVTVLAVEVICPDGQVHPKDYHNEVDKATCCPKDAAKDATTCFMGKYINPTINFLAAAVGLVVLISVIAGGIQYSTSDGDSGKAAAAKQRILNSLGALAAFVFLYAFMQWIVPGGI
jgi:hypothetical protein